MSILRRATALGALVVAALLMVPGPASAEPATQPKCPETRANLAGQHITAETKLPNLTCADLHGAVFDGLDLIQAGLAGANAQGASFQNTRLGQAHFEGADLRGAHFEGADLGQASLERADARNAFFGDTDLTQADLQGADLRGADLLHASLTQANLTGADLRGAQTWWTDSIQANVDGVKADFTDLRTFQFGLVTVAAGALLLILAVVAAARRRPTASDPRLTAGRPVLVFVLVFGACSLFGAEIFPLMFVHRWLPLLAGAVLVLLGGLTRVFWPPARGTAAG